MTDDPKCTADNARFIVRELRPAPGPAPKEG
jgi:hypothetical protein